MNESHGIINRTIGSDAKGLAAIDINKTLNSCGFGPEAKELVKDSLKN